MDIWKVNKFNFLNEEVEEFISRLNQNLVKIKNPSYLKSTYSFFIRHITQAQSWPWDSQIAD